MSTARGNRGTCLGAFDSTEHDHESVMSRLTWEPVSGIEPLTCRLQEVRPRALCALAARMARVITLKAPTALALFGASFHEPCHADGGQSPWP
jgi:hypothetical protein